MTKKTNLKTDLSFAIPASSGVIASILEDLTKEDPSREKANAALAGATCNNTNCCRKNRS